MKANIFNKKVMLHFSIYIISWFTVFWQALCTAFNNIAAYNRNICKFIAFTLSFTISISMPFLTHNSILNATPLDTIMGLEIGEQAAVPIIMYHVLSKNPKNKWEITPSNFEDDLIYLSKNGFTTVFMQDIIDFVHDGKALPEKPIVLTFDDGSYSTVTYMMPLLEQYNMKASLAIIGKETDKYTKIKNEDKRIKRHPHLTWDDIDMILASGLIEIICHSYDLHGRNGAGKLLHESESEYKNRFTKDLRAFDEALKQNTGLFTKSFAYPLGVISKISDDILKDAGYLASLSCYENTNIITVGEYECLYKLNRHLRPPRVTSKSFFENKFVLVQ